MSRSENPVTSEFRRKVAAVEVGKRWLQEGKPWKHLDPYTQEALIKAGVTPPPDQLYTQDDVAVAQSRIVSLMTTDEEYAKARDAYALKLRQMAKDIPPRADSMLWDIAQGCYGKPLDDLSHEQKLDCYAMFGRAQTPAKSRPRRFLLQYYAHDLYRRAYGDLLENQKATCNELVERDARLDRDLDEPPKPMVLQDFQQALCNRIALDHYGEPFWKLGEPERQMCRVHANTEAEEAARPRKDQT